VLYPQFPEAGFIYFPNKRHAQLNIKLAQQLKYMKDFRYRAVRLCQDKILDWFFAVGIHIKFYLPVQNTLNKTKRRANHSPFLYFLMVGAGRFELPTF
jgi:hypothetical protein